MENYRKILELLYELLRLSGDTHWANLINKDIYNWDTKKSTRGFKSHFGGMGSINDLTIGEQNPKGIWQSILFDLLLNRAWNMLYNKSTSSHYDNQIQGSVCDNCSYAEINLYNLEYFLPRKILPNIINNYLQKDNFMDLLKIEDFQNSVETNLVRSKLIEAIEKQKIHYSDSRIAINRDCPKCKQRKMSAKYWDIKLELNQQQPNNKNLPLNLTPEKPWWKKLRS